MNTHGFVIDCSARFYDRWAECGWGTAELDGSHPGVVGRDPHVEIRTGTGQLSGLQRVAQGWPLHTGIQYQNQTTNMLVLFYLSSNYIQVYNVL